MPPLRDSAEFAARAAEVPAMVDYVADAAGRAGVGARRLAHLRIAVEEIALNICDHAYGGADGRLEIAVGGDAHRFVTELYDDGPAFDPGAAPAPDLDTAVVDRRVGGLGVFLVQRLMDEFRYRRERSRNIVTLVVLDGDGGERE